MTRTIFYTASSLDGFLADDADSLSWLFAVPGGDCAETGDAGFAGFFEGIGVLVEGSTTYRWVLAHENLEAQPAKWQEFYGARPTFVFTTQELSRPVGADVRLVDGSVSAAWGDIVDAAGDRDIWIVGGGDLAGQFADAGLLDELRVSIAPVTLGSGRPLLPRRIESDRLTLTDVIRTGQFVQLVYAVSPPPAG